ncbi:MAG: L,D-transpeptidase family protein [Actinomycetes bacterium]
MSTARSANRGASMSRWRRAAFAMTAALIIPVGAVTHATTATAATPEHRKIVTVSVKSASSTYGKLTAWRWSTKQQRYVRSFKPVRAYVGTGGVGQASEYVSRTPAGVFGLTEAFGRQPNPGTRLPYRQVGYSSWWVNDVSSRYYNTYQECTPGGQCGFNQSASEQLGAISLYRYAVVMDYNRNPVKSGAGSAFFLHVSAGKATEGCVAIREGKLTRLMRWLTPAKDPVISIGVGASAYQPIR